ncbi:NAD(P)-dependent oxidoreductase [Streptomyces ipomoeae]|uniref:NAD-dependent epimerase/dehydratase family protein n=1 Tax=Streptomyces ipomoeae TaxID=103232 RepID=UPI00066263E9|nr:NAD(P)-dependent oxidoreductase [Streptomyces ipomoeae]MDX2692797.1 NAD(P)-dependent oxidoreductase [Streptomyces ipomoeae]MDX2819616.1 NAD(P)-dependent oxidoreductase [Streptomyces ipomoeae]MDX2838345.1 NAD(P)-dependent oxidoreductase [Streptomyces ipomoeae]MDX2872665.1 NAD(P)-dependent oxidoreductase [Streptomyces ipomoeae]
MAAAHSPRLICVTGGSGFIGSAFLRHVSAVSDTRLRVLDLTPPPKDVEAEFVRGSITDPGPLRQAFEGADTVVHLAGELGVVNCQHNPHKVIDINIGGTAAVTAAALEAGAEHLLFCSTSEIYGDGTGRVLSEDAVARPHSLYGRAKLLSESVVAEFARSPGRRATVVRPFNVYGPGQRPDFVVSRFVELASRGEPLTVHGDGAQIRTFTYVDDLAAGMWAALCRPASEGAPFEIYNLASQQTFSITEVVEMVNDLAGSDSPVVRISPGEAGRDAAQEVTVRIPSAAKAEEHLGFRASVTLSEGIRRCLAARPASPLGSAR